MTPADYAIWRSKKLWRFYELPFLLKGWQPDRNVLLRPESEAEKDVVQLHDNLFEVASRDPNLRMWDHRRNCFLVNDEAISASSLLGWANKIEFVRVPLELACLIPKPEKLASVSQSTNNGIQDLNSSNTRERETLLLIIAAMAHKQGLVLKNPYAVASDVIKMLELIGIQRSKNTIADKLKEAYQLQKEKAE